MKPEVRNMHKMTKAQWAEGNNIYCGRGSPWGNPFVLGEDGDRDEVCDRFEREVLPHLDVQQLIGMNLVCYCAPLRCHCDALLEKAARLGS